jgi:hypothetical protein
MSDLSPQSDPKRTLIRSRGIAPAAGRKQRFRERLSLRGGQPARLLLAEQDPDCPENQRQHDADEGAYARNARPE